MPKSEAELPPGAERLMQIHGDAWVAHLEAKTTLRKKICIPEYVPLYENRTLTLDQAAFATCPVDTEDPWVALRSLILAARIASTAIPSYRDELGKIIQLLLTPRRGTGRVRTGYSLAEIREQVSVDDARALVYEIWKQNPEAVKAVPCKTVYADEEPSAGKTRSTVQVFLLDESIPFCEPGISFSDEERWQINFVDRNAYYLLAGWRKDPPVK